MIGRLVLSDRNIYKIKSGNKQISARKCYILSDNSSGILVKTSKEFNSRDEYIKFDPNTNTILEGLGQVGQDSSDLDIYYNLFTLNWLSTNKYTKLWEEYLNLEFDLANKVGINRINYENTVITIDPDKSIDLDDGFSFISDDLFYQLDIHIADPVSWFNFDDKKFKIIFDELLKRQQSCYINKYNKSNYQNHLLPPKIVELISLLEFKSDLVKDYKISKRALSFCFKISKETNKIIEFELKPTNLNNIINYTYDKYDEYINSKLNIKKQLVDITNILIKIIGLDEISYPNLNITDNISHKIIEIFMILTNWWGGNHLLKIIKSEPILRIQDKNILGEDFNINIVPEYARPFLSLSANYIESTFNDNKNLTFNHNSLGINNYAHLSSPMRRFIDMLNHYKFYHSNYILNNERLYDLPKIYDINFNLDIINNQIKKQKKISNAWALVKFIKSNPELNKFKACLFDWVELETNKITGLIVLYNQNNKFISIINVELPQIELTTNLSKYMEFNIELYYNSNNFKSTKFPFSIKIIQ